MLLAQDICSSKSIANIVVKIVVVGTTYCASAVVFPVFSQHMKLPKKRVHNRGSQIPLFFLLNPAIPPLFTPRSRSRPIFFNEILDIFCLIIDIGVMTYLLTIISVRGGGAGGAAAPPCQEKLVLFGQN